MPDEIELCTACSSPTGRAGRTEDSIYTTFVHSGKEAGPFCFSCYRLLVKSGVIVEE